MEFDSESTHPMDFANVAPQKEARFVTDFTWGPTTAELSKLVIIKEYAIC